MLHLDAQNPIQEILRSRIIVDVDMITDFRLSRLQQALAKPPFFMIVVIFGFLVTMACFGLYKPQVVTVVLVTMYMFLLGLVIYLILAFSDPFQGMPGVDPSPFESVLEKMEKLD